MSTISRRSVLAASAGAILGNSLFTGQTAQAEASATLRKPLQVRYCLNTSTIRDQGLSLVEEIDLISKAGYQGIEPWIREIEAYQEAGHSLSDLRKRIADAGLKVESVIGFAAWIVDDEEARKKGIEHLKRDMDLVEKIGGRLIAAPPIGVHHAEADRLDLFTVAERYAAILKAGEETGVIPQLEVWGFSPNLSRLGEVLFVAAESGHPDACLLPDVYHLHRGGNRFEGLGLLASSSIHCFHFNDYPAEPAHHELNDSQRVYPGDGAAPWETIVGILQKMNFNGAISLELFNPEYWKQPAEQVARTGLQKMKSIIERYSA